MSLARLSSEDRGLAAVEFAIGAPFLLALIYGLAQLSILMFAQSGLNHAVGEAARVASVYPRPTENRITQAALRSRFGLSPTRLAAPQLTHTTSSGVDYVTISLSYSAEVDLLFLPSKRLTLSETRTVAIHPVS
jgi:Flp pilus assembly protein TadG